MACKRYGEPRASVEGLGKPRVGKHVWVSSILFIMIAGVLAQPVLAQLVGPTGPYNLWFDLTIVGSDRYPGGTVLFVVSFTNAGTDDAMVVESINTTILMLPWMMYVASGLPVIINLGEQLGVIFNVTIPDDQRPGEIPYTLSANWGYWSEDTWVDGNPLEYKSRLTILPNPYALQRQVSSLQANVSSLTQTVSSQDRTIASLQTNVSSLNEMARSLRGNLTAAEQTIGSQNAQVSQLQATTASQRDNITSLQSELNTMRTEMYVLACTTIVFLATTVYYATRKSRPPEPTR